MSLSLNVPILTAKFFTLVTSLQNINVTVLGLHDRQVLEQFTADLHLAKILNRELSKRALKYTHFELKSIVIQENKFPRLIQDLWLFYISVFNDSDGTALGAVGSRIKTNKAVT